MNTSRTQADTMVRACKYEHKQKNESIKAHLMLQFTLQYSIPIMKLCFHFSPRLAVNYSIIEHNLKLTPHFF